MLSPFHRLLILQYFDSNMSAQEIQTYQNQLKRLPFYEFDSPKSLSQLCVSEIWKNEKIYSKKLGVIKFYPKEKQNLANQFSFASENVTIVPVGFPSINLGQICLRKNSKLSRLYKGLQIFETSKSGFFIRNVAPRIANISNKDLWELIRFVVNNFESLCNENDNFLQTLKHLSFIPNLRGERKRACELVHSSAFFNYFYKGREDVLPDLPERDHDRWTIFLKKIGLRTDPSDEEIVNCAKKIAGEYERRDVSEEIMEVAKVILDHLGSETFDSVRDLKFVPAQIDSRRDKQNKPYLSALKEIQPECNSNLCWTVSSFFHPELLIAQDFFKKFKMEEAPPELVKRHLFNIVNGNFFDSFNSLQEVYTFLDNLEEEKILDLNLGEQKIFLISDICSPEFFFSASKLRMECKDFLCPYFVRVPQELRNLERLLSVCGVKQGLEPQDVLSILDEVQRKTEGKPLVADQSDLVKNCLQKILKCKSSNQQAIEDDKLWIPDTNMVLRKLKEIVFFDISSMKSKIDCSKILCVHHNFQSLAKKLGVAKLSSVVAETYDKSKEKQEISQHQFTEKFSRLIGSKEFLEGIKRMMHHKGKGETEMEKAEQFISFQVKVFASLSSVIVDSRNGRNITHPSHRPKSNCFLDQVSKTIFISSQAPPFLLPYLLAVEIINYVGEDLPVSPLQTILGVESPSQIEDCLDLLNITSFESKESIEEEVDPNILNINPMCSYFIGEVVVCKKEESLKTGKVRSLERVKGHKFLSKIGVLCEGEEVVMDCSFLYKLGSVGVIEKNNLERHKECFEKEIETFQFSSKESKEMLVQRWKDTISNQKSL